MSTFNREIVLVLLFIFSATGSWAQSLMGLYFDEAGTQTEISTDSADELIPVYLVLHSDDISGNLTHWECRLSSLGGSIFQQLELTLNGWNEFSQLNTFRVSLAEPIPMSETLVLATGEVLVSSPGISGQIYIQPLDEPTVDDPQTVFQPAIAIDEQWIPVETSPECEAQPAALVNDDGQVPQWAMNLYTPILIGDIHGRFNIFLSNSGPVSFSGRVFGLVGYGEVNETFHLNPGESETISFGYSDGLVGLEICDEVTEIPCFRNINESTRLVTYPQSMEFLTVDWPPSGEPQSQEFSLYNISYSSLNFEVTSCPSFQVEISTEPLGIGEYRTGLITFLPESLGLHECAIRFQAYGGGYELLNVLGYAGEAVYAQSDTLDFQNVGIGFPLTKYMTIGNFSPVEVEFVITEPTDPAFSLPGGNGPFTLQPDQGMQVAVNIDPVSAGPFSIEWDLGILNSPVMLVGSVFDEIPQLSFDPPQLDFGALFSGNSFVSTIAVSNTGQISFQGEFVVSGDGFSSVGSVVLDLDSPQYPGDNSSQDIRVRFNAEEAGYYSGVVQFVPDTGAAMELSGQCNSFVVTPELLPFGFSNPGQPLSRTIVILNEGPVDLVGQAYFSNPGEFSLQEELVEINLAPNQEQEIGVVFSGQEGNWVDCLQLPLGQELRIEAFCHEGDNPVEIGGFFDYGSFSVNQIQAAAGDTVTVYIYAPQILSGREGCADLVDYILYGWEGLIDISGENELLSLEPGSSWDNTLEPPSFHCFSDWGWGGGGDDILATAQILVSCEDCWTEIRVLPLENPIFPGFPAVRRGMPWLNYLVQALTTTDEPLVATINSTFVGVQLPRPIAQQNINSVHLHWEVDSTFEACHLYRRVDASTAVRLTETPLPVTNGRLEFIDQPDLSAGSTAYYCYAVLRNGLEVGLSPEVEVNFANLPPIGTAFHGNYPNPFNPNTTFSFDLAVPGQVELGIYDLGGRRVCRLIHEYMTAGSHETIWTGVNDDGNAVASGVYFARMQADGKVMMRKIALLK